MSSASGKSFEKGQAACTEAPAKERESAQPAGPHDAVLALQHAAGNRAVTSLLVGGSGKPLDSGTREEMESKFGEDFGEVRVHTGGGATSAANEAHAKAYTFGRDIVFGEGHYAPATTGGKRLLAHELAHVVQQSRLSGTRSNLAETGSLEASAEQAADASLQTSSRVQVSGAAAPRMARTPKDKKLLDLLRQKGVEMPWVGKGPGISSSQLGYLRDVKKFRKAYKAEHGESYLFTSLRVL